MDTVYFREKEMEKEVDWGDVTIGLPNTLGRKQALWSHLPCPGLPSL